VEGLTLAELAGILVDAGLPARGFSLDLAALDSMLDRGVAPLVLHYSRPAPHWALLFGRSGKLYQLGDPGRGFELLGEEELLRRWSGAAIVLEPSAVPAGLRVAAAEAARRSLARRSALEGRAVLAGTGTVAAIPSRIVPTSERGVGAPPEPSGRLEARLGIAGGFSLEADQGIEARLCLDVSGERWQAGLVLPAAIVPRMDSWGIEIGLPGLRAAISSVDGPASVSLFLDALGAIEDDRVEGARGSRADLASPFGLLDGGVAFARVLDPFVIMATIDLAVGETQPGTLCWFPGLTMAATEAVSERFFLCLEGGVRAAILPSGLSWHGSFGLRVTLAVEGGDGYFGFMEGGKGSSLAFGAGLEMSGGE
jgi:hypothetical protein